MGVIKGPVDSRVFCAVVSHVAIILVEKKTQIQKVLAGGKSSKRH